MKKIRVSVGRFQIAQFTGVEFVVDVGMKDSGLFSDGLIHRPARREPIF